MITLLISGKAEGIVANAYGSVIRWGSQDTSEYVVKMRMMEMTGSA